MSKLFRRTSSLLGFLLAFTLIGSYAPARAVVANCDGSSTQNTMKVTALHGQVVYVDTGARPRLDAAYVSYRVTNTSASAREDIWIELSGFTGNSVKLANPLDSTTIIDELPGSSSETTYFLLQATTPTTTDQVHTVKIYDNRPDLGGTVLYTCNYTFTDVKDTIKAKSNKVVSVSTSNTAPVLGELLTFTIEGKTGVVGQGEAPDGDIMWFSPSAYASWPTRALRLESISVLLDADGNFSTTSDQGTYTDQLIITDVQSITLGGPSNRIGSNSRYRAQYNFRVIGSAPNGTKVVPVAQISSGRKIKHTDTLTTDTGPFPELTFDKVDTTININKSASVVDPDDPAGFSTVKYTLDITTNSTEELLIDEIVDDPDSGIDIVEGSVKFSDNRNITLITMRDPDVDVSGNNIFIGPYYVKASNGAQIEYLAYIPRPSTPTVYRNYAYGYIGDRLIGKTDAAVDGIKITSGPDGPVINDDERSIGPTISTGTASDVTTTAATINGLIDPNENFTAFGFQYSTNANLTSPTCVQTAGSASQSNSIDEVAYLYGLTGLTANTTYYFRAVGNSDASIAITDACTTPDLVGEIFSFTTTPQGLLSQTITWDAVFSNLTTSTPLTLTTAATASSGLPVVLTPTNPDVCTVTEQPDPDNATAGYAVITIVGPGTCELTATQDGNASYTAATPVVKSFTVSGVNLNLTIVGSGTVTSDVGNVNCSASCAKSIRTDTAIVLTATPATGYVFTGWSGACSGSSTCSLTMSEARTVTATFSEAPYTINVSVTGNGDISNSKNADVCDSTCTIGVVFGNSVTLTPTAGRGWEFTGWTGACTGTGNCVLTIDGDKSVTATFAKRAARVDVTTQGNGKVTNNYGNPDCRGNCSINAFELESITLTANPDAGWEFTGWTGACTGTSSTCVISLEPPSSSPTLSGTSATVSSTSLNQLIKSTEATFQITQETLSVAISGNGSTSDNGTFNCLVSSCTQDYDYNTVVTLTALADPGWEFSGWSGDCSGTSTCSVTMSAAKSVTATFTQITHTLYVTIIGGGTVTDTGTLSCGIDCSEVYNEGDVVTLSASPDPSYFFAGWTGDCLGLNDCTVTITDDMNVTAEFTLVPIVTHDLTMNILGNGSISGDLSCNSASCTETLNENNVVTLSADPATGWEFLGWSGDCSGTTTCTVSMTADHLVTAEFAQIERDLTINIVGNGSVSDSSTIYCTIDCIQTLYDGDQVTLSATPDTGWEFTGWSDDCSGTSTCSLTMNAAKSVTATFTQITHTLTMNIVGNGSISGDFSCNAASCDEEIIGNTAVSLTATPDTGWEFSGWSVDCIGADPCSVTMSADKTVTATFTRIVHDLTIDVVGNGSVSDSGTINCSVDCVESINEGDQVTLSATPDTGWEFSGWSGDCSGTGTCTLTVNAAKSVTATFTQITYTLEILISGSGSVDDGGFIACSTDCIKTLNHGESVTLTALPDAGFYFAGWTGSCSGTSTCSITMTANTSVTATFLLIPIITYDLTIEVVGDGEVGDGGSITCTSNCTETLTEDTQITLSVTPDAGWEFSGWSGACSGIATCTITMTENKSVTATFTQITYDLAIDIVGSGSVSGDANCSSDCIETFLENEVVVLSATPASGWEFTGWSGACSGTSTCSVTMSEAKEVSATFTQITHTLTITIIGNGTVGGDYSCNSSPCTITINEGEIVDLTSTPFAGWEFAGWSDDCMSAGACSFTMSENKSVTATFTQITHDLTININGNGSVSDSGAITCTTNCTETLNEGTSLVLSATPDAGWEFTGWSGACSGTGTCSITMNGDTSVTATFVLITIDLGLNVLGNGAISGDFACSDTCTEITTENQVVTLSAVPDTGWEFTGWSGACSGTGTCSITMDTDKTVTATFTQITHSLSITISGNGSVTDSAAIDCAVSCTEIIAGGEIITLSANPDPNWYFVGWSGDCSGTGTCSTTMNGNKTVIAEFLLIPVVAYDLTINVIGDGTVSESGSISSGTASHDDSDEDSISCRSNCTFPVVVGTVLTLSARPDAGWEFTGWSGACSGTGTCNITMDGPKPVTANFTQIQTVSLSITVVGSGTIIGEGISCRDECVYEVESDSIVNLAAMPDIDWNFEGWSQICSGTGTCDISMSSSRSVTATFQRDLLVNPNTLTIKIIGMGEVTVNNAEVCVDECTYSFLPGTDVTLNSDANQEWQFSHWNEICQSENCTVNMSSDMVLSVYFAPPPPPATYSPTLKKTMISWSEVPAPDGEDILYTVLSKGNVVCQTTNLTCTVMRILGPKHDLKIQSKMLTMDSVDGPVLLKKGKLLLTIRFDFDKANVKERYQQTLKKIAKAFAEAGFTQYEIRGHTDSRGTNSYNKLLSQFRALNVIREMRKVAKLSYKTTWYGERKPVASNKSVKGRKENRRTEVRIIL